MYFLVLTIFIACLVSGCDVYKPVTSLSDNEIAGRWVITEDSKEFLKKKDFCCADKPTELIISEDHTFKRSIRANAKAR
jgi:hypothetical protein